MQTQNDTDEQEHDDERQVWRADEERTKGTERAPGFLVGHSQLGRDPLRVPELASPAAPTFLCDDEDSLCDTDGHEIG